MDAPRFAAVPLVALADRRLTLEQIRVLIALLSFASKDSPVVFPSRQAISELTGMHLANISSATSALENLGWLKKDGKGGYSKATRYTITVPDTVAEQATGPSSRLGKGTPLPIRLGAKNTPIEQTNRTHKGESAEPEGFAECWSAYPMRIGTNNRAQALRAYQARIKAGVSNADILAGVKRYAVYCQSEGITATRYVKQAATFFGPDHHFADTWSAAPDAASNDLGTPEFMTAAMRTNKEAAHVD